MSDIQLYNKEGALVGTLDLPKTLEAPPEKAILWQAIRMYLANQREGNADTKRRGEVRGGGKKPWAQKHTGRARAGTIRSPLWRKGGVVFGPHPREYRYELPRKIRRAALLQSLRAKVETKNLLAVESLEGLPSKTKAFAEFLKKIKVEAGAVVVVDQVHPHLFRVSRNLPNVVVRVAKDLNCYEVLRFPHLVVTSAGWKKLQEHLS